MDEHIQDISLILDCNETLKLTTQTARKSEFNRVKSVLNMTGFDTQSRATFFRHRAESR